MGKSKKDLKQKAIKTKTTIAATSVKEILDTPKVGSQPNSPSKKSKSK